MIVTKDTNADELCATCKNRPICKYALTGQEALSGLRIGDGDGPFTVSIECKHRVLDINWGPCDANNSVAKEK